MSDKPLFVPLPDADDSWSPPPMPSDSEEPAAVEAAPQQVSAEEKPTPREPTYEDLTLPGMPAGQPGSDQVLAVAGAEAPAAADADAAPEPELPVAEPPEPVAAPPAPIAAPPGPPVAAEPPFSVPPPTAGDSAPPGGEPPEEDGKRMTLVEHLTELRQVLIVSLSAWGIASIVGLVISHWIVLLLTKPLDTLHLKPVVLSPMGIFTIHLKVGLVAGLVLALPVILQQTWTFVAPGLTRKERRFAGPLMVSSLGLFALGAVLAFGFMFIGIRLVQLTTGITGIQYLPELNSYLGTMVVLILAFGITFEFPVALVLMAMVGLMTSARLRHARRAAYLVIAAVGYLITPGVDPVTPLALIVPLFLLYEASILVIRRMGK